jgi:CRISPR-associated protein Cas1
MEVLHVLHQGAELRLSGETIGVWLKGDCLSVARVPLLEAIVLHGRVHLTAPVVSRLLAEGIDCAYVSTSGRFLGRLESLGSPAARLRALQALAFVRPQLRLSAARAIARHKIISEWRVLRALRCQTSLELDWLLERLRSAGSVPEVRGVEGYATRRYFSALRGRLPESHQRWTRQRHPAPDGLNALLGYGYAILQSRVHAAVAVVGLDPWLGFLHQVGRPRPGFVLDMMEEFRAPIVDYTCWRLLQGLGASGWWEPTPQGARLGDQAKRTLIEAIERRLASQTAHGPTKTRTTLEGAIELQVRGFAAVLSGGRRAYRPLREAPLP